MFRLSVAAELLLQLLLMDTLKRQLSLARSLGLSCVPGTVHYSHVASSVVRVEHSIELLCVSLARLGVPRPQTQILGSTLCAGLASLARSASV